MNYANKTDERMVPKLVNRGGSWQIIRAMDKPGWFNINKTPSGELRKSRQPDKAHMPEVLQVESDDPFGVVLAWRGAVDLDLTENEWKPATVTLANPPSVSGLIPALFGLLSEIFDVTRAEVESHQREQRVTKPRWVMAVFLIRECGYSLPLAGRVFGGRDHTTMLNARRQLPKLLAKNPEFAVLADEFNSLARKLLEGGG
jgi:hypothetical protein